MGLWGGIVRIYIIDETYYLYIPPVVHTPKWYNCSTNGGVGSPHPYPRP